jgi:hypothetical protein
MRPWFFRHTFTFSVSQSRNQLCEIQCNELLYKLPNTIDSLRKVDNAILPTVIIKQALSLILVA